MHIFEIFFLMTLKFWKFKLCCKTQVIRSLGQICLFFKLNSSKYTWSAAMSDFDNRKKVVNHFTLLHCLHPYTLINSWWIFNEFAYNLRTQLLMKIFPWTNNITLLFLVAGTGMFLVLKEFLVCVPNFPGNSTDDK